MTKVAFTNIAAHPQKLHGNTMLSCRVSWPSVP